MVVLLQEHEAFIILYKDKYSYIKIVNNNFLKNYEIIITLQQYCTQFITIRKLYISWKHIQYSSIHI